MNLILNKHLNLSGMRVKLREKSFVPDRLFRFFQFIFPYTRALFHPFHHLIFHSLYRLRLA